MLGIAVAGCNQPDLAADLLDEASRRAPAARHPAHDAIEALTRSGRDGAVARYIDAAVALAPNDARLLAAAGAWLQRTDQGEAAVAVLRRAIALAPDLADARISLACAEADGGALEQAMRELRGLTEAGQGGAAALGNLGVMLSVEGRHVEALAAFEAARSIDPGGLQLAVNHGMALLKAGRLEEGWPLFNRRLAQPGQSAMPPERLLPIGTDLAGKTILVLHDSGLGDTLQFARFLPRLADAGARVLVWAPQALHRLLASIPGVALVFSDEREWPGHDWHCPIMRLAEVFATTLATIPGAPYLRADPALVRAWTARLPAHRLRRVGVVWAGSTREAQPELAGAGRRRDIDPALLVPLFSIPGLQWISLQWRARPPHPAVMDVLADAQDLADTAALVATLDAVVTVDTAVAHLAGALGRPVFLLDRYDNCWRWLSGRDTSPWYPAVRIFRQARWGEWGPVIDRLKAALSLPG